MSQLNFDNRIAFTPIEAPGPAPEAKPNSGEGFDEHLASARRNEPPDDAPKPPSSDDDGRPRAADKAGTDADTDHAPTGPAEPADAREDRNDDADHADTPDEAKNPETDVASSDAADSDEADEEASVEALVSQALAAELASAVVQEKVDTEPAPSERPPEDETSQPDPVDNGTGEQTRAGATESLLEEQAALAADRDTPDKTSTAPQDHAEAADGPADQAKGELLESARVEPESSDTQGKETQGNETPSEDTPGTKRAATARSAGSDGSESAPAPRTDTQSPAASHASQEPAARDTVASQPAAAEQNGPTVAAASSNDPAPQSASAAEAPPAGSVGGPVPGTQPTAQSARAGAAAEIQDNQAADAIDRVRFVGRIARALEAASGRGGGLRLRLHPPQLGSLRLEMNVEGGVLTARLEAESAAARNLLLDNLPALRERLAGQDIRVERFDVDLGMRSSGGSPQGPGDQQHNQRQPPDSSADSPADAQVQAAADRAGPNQSSGTGRFDVTI